MKLYIIWRVVKGLNEFGLIEDRGKAIDSIWLCDKNANNRLNELAKIQPSIRLVTYELEEVDTSDEPFSNLQSPEPYEYYFP